MRKIFSHKDTQTAKQFNNPILTKNPGKNNLSTSKTHFLTAMAMFSAFIFILGLTPLGFLNIPGAAITFVHIPVIIGSYFYGVKGGTVLGFVFGLVSLIRAFTTPDVIAAIILGTNTGGFTFYNLFLIIVILFVPRILVGIFSALVFKGLSHMKKFKNESISMAVSAFVGSMTNTILVLGGLYLFAFEQTALANGVQGASSNIQLLNILIGVVAVNGVIEAVFATVLCTGIGKGVGAFLNKLKS